MTQIEHKYKILLCEDDPSLGKILQSFFEMHGFAVTLEQDGRAGLLAFRKGYFDICLLDVMMPQMDGFELAKEIRSISPDVPLFFMTAKNMKEDLIKGYNLGADDYITKPFDTDVVLMKIRAIIKRKEDRTELEKVDEIIQIGNYTYNSKMRELLINGKVTQKLSPTESRLLILLYQFRDTILQREEALNRIWGTDTYFNSRSMDVYITRLRKYFSEDKRVEIQNLYSTGFKLNLPD